jgi:Trk K+ transport system NAD-binding subunit
MITYSHRIYALAEPWLGHFERAGAPREPLEDAAEAGRAHEVLLFGLGRYGTAIVLRLKKRGMRVLGIDFNPQAVRRWRELGLEAEFGDASDAEFVAELPLRGARWVVSTVPIQPAGLTHEDTRRTLIQLARTGGFSGRIAAAAHSAQDAEALLGAGADLVLEPFQDAADRAVELLCGAAAEERTEIPEIAAEDRLTA